MYDSGSGRTTGYSYDLSGRLVKYREKGTGYDHSVSYTYDKENNLTQLTEKIGTATHTTGYEYDSDNRIEKVTADGGTAAAADDISVVYAYDGFGRVSGQTVKYGTETVLIRQPGYDKITGAATTDAQIDTYTVRNKNGATIASYSYTYDANGNILSVSDGTNTTTYTYDSQNQLIREDNQAAGKSWTWTYDKGGNIQSKSEYAYTTGTLGTATGTATYVYDSSWGDLLVSYNGVALNNDRIGNPAALNGRSYVWEHGRELRKVTYANTEWTNTYDVNGLRAKREGGGKTYSYIYNGSQLSRMTVGSNTLTFSYDASGTPVSVIHNGTTYYYATNLQGDVVALLNASGTAVVTYTYDAWGKLLSTGGTLASTLGVLNPIRYRGYVYDTETGLYYLQSRYYDPEVGRFINADAFASTGIGLIGSNMFAYCNNNPVVNYDSSGAVPISFYDGRDVNPLYIGHLGMGGGGGGGSSEFSGGPSANRKSSRQQAKDIVQRELDYLTNTDPAVAAEADHIAFFHGVPVVKSDYVDSAFSFGVIVMGRKNKNPITVQHEYGHTLHLMDIGPISYTITVFIPSVLGCHFGNDTYQKNYYSYPYEYIADVLGQVDPKERSYNGAMTRWWKIYYLYTDIMGLLYGWI